MASSALISVTKQVAVFNPFILGGKIQKKAKVDFVPPVSTKCLIDLKTTTDASPDAFSRKLWDLDYHVQAAYYLDLWNEVTGENRTAFVFIVVETEPPYAVSVFNLSGKAICIGRETYVKDLQRMMECLERNEWPAYSNEVVEINLPPWADKIAA